MAIKTIKLVGGPAADIHVVVNEDVNVYQVHVNEVVNAKQVSDTDIHAEVEYVAKTYKATNEWVNGVQIFKYID